MARCHSRGMCDAVLHCGTDADSGQVFFKVVQEGDEGSITVDNKQFEDGFEGLVKMSFQYPLAWLKEINGGEDLYNADEHSILHDKISELREDFIDSVFEVNAKLSADDFITSIKKNASWIYEPE